MKDYSEYSVEVQPTARNLYEAMALREWREAEELSLKLLNLAHELYKIAIKEQIVSGSGFR